MRALSPRTTAAAGLACTVLLIGTAGPAAAYSPAEYKKDGIAATNKERTDRDLGALGKDSCLQKFAARQARKQAKADKMSHQPMDPIMKKCGLDRVGENVAYGFSTGQSVVDAWMNSPEHRANILDGRFARIGFAAAQSSDGTWYVSQVFGRPS